MIFFLFSSLEAVTGLPEPAGYMLVFVLGACVGSFLNVAIHRIPRRESVIFPNSACPKCKTLIKIYDNIPVLSWLILGGKCRSCKEPISPRYPAVELLSALLFILVYWRIGFNAFLPACLIFVSAIVALIFIDAGHMILPNIITYPLLIFALLVRLIYPIAFSASYFSDIGYPPASYFISYPAWLISLGAAIFGALVGGGSLWLIGEIWKRLRGVDAMGLGDVKMMFGVGALIGWRLVLLSIFIGAFAGAAIGSVYILRQKEKDFQAQIPFGIFLGIGSIISLLFGERLIYWYLNTF